MHRDLPRACSLLLVAALLSPVAGFAQVPSVAAAGSAAASASPVDTAKPPGAMLPDAAAVQRSSSGVAYLSGGAGEEARAAMDAQRSRFPFKVVVSACSGEYLVADRLSIRSGQREVLAVDGVGPFVMTQVPAGSVTVEATYQGKTARRTAKGGRQTVNLCFRV